MLFYQLFAQCVDLATLTGPGLHRRGSLADQPLANREGCGNVATFPLPTGTTLAPRSRKLFRSLKPLCCGQLKACCRSALEQQ